ncbi:hypothetical protein BH11MYX3_BH11MYX3_05640 [soil metagenome]
MRAPLEVVTAPRFWKRLKWTSILFAPFSAFGLYGAYERATNPAYQRESGMVVALIAVSIFIVTFPAIFILMRRSWVQWFDADGVRLRNGRRFAWNDFVKCEPRVSMRTQMVNHYDLVFKTGTAGVFHLMTDNSEEVMEVLGQLQRGVNPWSTT